MNLSSQIKNLRNAKGISQEELASRIYVSRQTISNWETEKSYPDIQSLLLLSVLFDVSLDELVKGDLEMMKQTVDASKMTSWSWVMLIGLVLATLCLIPCFHIFGWVGLVIPGALYALSLGAAIYIEVLKKRHHVKTYSEILAFVSNEELDAQQAAAERKVHTQKTALLALAFGLGAAVLIFLSGAIYFSFFV